MNAAPQSEFSSFANDRFLSVIDELNPWHRTGELPRGWVPEGERPLATLLWRRLHTDTPKRHQVILGPRRVGKTTVLRQTVRHLLNQGVTPRNVVWLQMDHPELTESSLGDQVRCLLAERDVTEDNPLFLMIDEIVYADRWDMWLKTFYDGQWPIKIAATASGTAIIRDRRAESGIGRWQEIHLMPVQLEEFLEFTWSDRLGSTPFVTTATLSDTLATLPQGHAGDPEKRDYVWRMILMMVGGFPELLFQGLDDLIEHNRDGSAVMNQLEDVALRSQRILLDDAVEKTIYKDIPEYTGIGNVAQLERLLYALAGQITGILSPSKLANELSLTQPTVDKYLSYLERSYLIFRLGNYSGHEGNIQRRGRKCYFVDGAVRSATLRRGIAPISDDKEQGMLLENLAASALHTLACVESQRLHYWRSKKDNEVDLIYGFEGKMLAFEIASSPTHSRRGLSALIDQYKHFHSKAYLVAPGCTVRRPDADGIGTLPFETFLRCVGAQTYRATKERLWL